MSRGVAVGGAGSAVLLVCTECDHAWEVSSGEVVGESAAAGSTGCPLCGGWTWVGELAGRE